MGWTKSRDPKVLGTPSNIADFFNLNLTYPLLNYSIFLCRYIMLCCDLDLDSLWYQALRDQSLYKIWPKSSNARLNNYGFYDFFAHVMWRCDLEFWSLDFELLQHNPRLSYWRSGTFSHAVLGGGAQPTLLSFCDAAAYIGTQSISSSLIYIALTALVIKLTTKYWCV